MATQARINALGNSRKISFVGSPSSLLLSVGRLRASVARLTGIGYGTLAARKISTGLHQGSARSIRRCVRHFAGLSLSARLAGDAESIVAARNEDSGRVSAAQPTNSPSKSDTRRPSCGAHLQRCGARRSAREGSGRQRTSPSTCEVKAQASRVCRARATYFCRSSQFLSCLARPEREAAT